MGKYWRPVEPPATSIGRCTRAALGSLVVVPVHRRELVPVVSGQTVRRIPRVPSHPQLEVRRLVVHPEHRHSVGQGVNTDQASTNDGLLNHSTMQFLAPVLAAEPVHKSILGQGDRLG